MLNLKATKNLRGLSVMGDYEDFDELQDAVYLIADSEYSEAFGFKQEAYQLLSLAYDVRHAKMGVREIKMMDNGSSAWNIDEQGYKELKSISKENLYYKVNVTVVSCIATVLAIKQLGYNAIEKYEYLMIHGYPDCTKPLKEKATMLEEYLYVEAINHKRLCEFHKKVNIQSIEDIMDPYHMLLKVKKALNTLQTFSECVWKELESILESKEVFRLYKKVEESNDEKNESHKILCSRYFEYLDVSYLKLRNKNQRIVMLNELIDHMIDLDDDYAQFCETWQAKAKTENCDPLELSCSYPNDFVW